MAKFSPLASLVEAKASMMIAVLQHPPWVSQNRLCKICSLFISLSPAELIAFCYKLRDPHDYLRWKPLLPRY